MKVAQQRIDKHKCRDPEFGSVLQHAWRSLIDMRIASLWLHKGINDHGRIMSELPELSATLSGSHDPDTSGSNGDEFLSTTSSSSSSSSSKNRAVGSFSSREYDKEINDARGLWEELRKKIPTDKPAPSRLASEFSKPQNSLHPKSGLCPWGHILESRQFLTLLLFFHH